MVDNTQIHYLIGGDDRQQADQYKKEARRLKALATRTANRGYITNADEIRERANFCERMAKEYASV